MVFHVGIDAWIGNVVVYNNEDKTSSEFDVTQIGYSGIDKIEKMFGEIKIKIGGELGCACIYLDWCYDNDIRKRIIEKGKEIGFFKIQIIDSASLKYLEFISQSEYNPKENDLIYILCDFWFIIWKKKNGKIIRILQFFNDFFFRSYETFFETIISDFANTYFENPCLIICDISINLDIKIIEKLCPVSKIVFHQNHLSVAEASLIKARIISRDLEFLKYKSESPLDGNIQVLINEKEVTSFSPWDSLPKEKHALIPIGKNENILNVVFKPHFLFVHNVRRNNAFSQFINEFTHELPGLYMNVRMKQIFTEQIIITSEMIDAGKLFLTFKIDKNIICSMDYLTETTTEKTKLYLRDLYFINTKKEKNIYDIPDKIETFNIGINVLGIDLGTSRCYAAVNRRSGIETIALDNTGERHLPSYVSFDEKTPKCGKEVMLRLKNFSKYTVFDLKRFIGKKLIDIENAKIWPFDIIDVKNKLKITVEGPGMALEKYPEEIAAILLKHIKQKTEEFQGKPSHKVVITVPAAFANSQKLATHVAAVFAGWNEIYLLPEPVAASLAYFVDRPIPQNANILLFDLGGGTMDVCIFKIENKKLEIIGNTGDTHLGGRDFDQLLINYFGAILLKNYGIDVNSNDKLKYRLMENCMEIKHTLSVHNEAILYVSDFNININDILKIARQQFEEMSNNLVKKIDITIQKSLEETNSTSNAINKVLIAGGGSRMPMIKKLLKDTFPDAEYCQEENPDEVIAIGAAYYAYYINSNDLQSSCSII